MQVVFKLHRGELGPGIPLAVFKLHRGELGPGIPLAVLVNYYSWYLFLPVVELPTGPWVLELWLAI